MTEPERTSYRGRVEKQTRRSAENPARWIERETADELLAKLKNLHRQTEMHDELLDVYETLHESQRHFREMVDALPAAIYTTDAEGRLTHFNPAAVQLSGRAPELGTDQWCVTWKLFWPDGTPMKHDECPMAVALKEGRIQDGVEAIAERPDGTRFWFTPYPRLLRDAEGRITGGINMLLDITERKKSEQASSLLAAIVDSSDDAIVSKTLDGIVTSWNKSAERLFGYTAGEAIGQHITLIVPQDRLDEEATIISRLRQGERIDHFETLRRRKDGTLLDVSLTISPVKDSTGRVVGASKVARDITGRKQIEQALRKSEERFRVIVKQAGAGVIQTDTAGRMVLVNQHWCEMLGYSEAELLEMDVADVTHPANLTPTLEAVSRLADGGPDFVIEKQYRRKDGSVLWANTSVTALRGAAGEYLGMVAFVTDIGEQRRRQMVAEGQKKAFERAASGDPLNAVLSILVRTAREQSASGARAAIFLIDGAVLRFAVSADMPETYTGAMDGFPIGPQYPSCGYSAWSGQTVIVRDVEQDPLWAPYVRLALAHGFRACWSFPILSFGGKVLGTFALYHAEAREPDPSDLGLVNLLADTAAVLIGRHQEAEERQRAVAALRESEERHRELAGKLDAEVHARTDELERQNGEMLEQAGHLRALSNRLMRLQDEERRRIARELHDSVGQDLAALSMCLEGAKRVAKGTPETAVQKLNEACEIVEKCSSEIRTLSHLLHPPLLEELGLASAIEWYVEGFASRSKIAVDLQMPSGFKRLDSSVELPLFRVLQECLTNIHRHSESKTATVKVEADEHKVSLEISDQGKGMETRDSRPNGGKRLGVGISGMRERLKDLGGTLEIHSTNQGTTVRAAIPLRADARAATP